MRLIILLISIKFEFSNSNSLQTHRFFFRIVFKLKSKSKLLLKNRLLNVYLNDIAHVSLYFFHTICFRTDLICGDAKLGSLFDEAWRMYEPLKYANQAPIDNCFWSPRWEKSLSVFVGFTNDSNQTLAGPPPWKPYKDADKRVRLIGCRNRST